MITRNRIKIWLSFAAGFAYLGMLAVNMLANALPLNHQTTGEVSARYDSLFAPAGFTFSIWGVIYLFLLVWVIVHITAAYSKNKSQIISAKTMFAFIVSCFLNSAWIFAWHYEYLSLSIIVMILLLGSLMWMYSEARKFQYQNNSTNKYISIPVSIYLGWISVATIANIAAWLVAQGWNGTPLSPEFWTILMSSVATVLCLLILFLHRNFAFTLVIIWALAGIFVKNQSATLSFSSVQIGVSCCIIILMGSSFFLIMKKGISS